MVKPIGDPPPMPPPRPPALSPSPLPPLRSLPWCDVPSDWWCATLCVAMVIAVCGYVGYVAWVAIK